MNSPSYKHAPDEIARHLAYDATTGAITWKISGPHHKAGDLAGSVYRDGHVWISLSGHKYPARVIAWVLMHGDWPDNPVHLVSDGMDISRDQKRILRQDFRPHNLVSKPRPLSTHPQAVAYRLRRHQFQAALAGVDTIANARDGVTDPTRPSIAWSQSAGVWVVRDNAMGLDTLPYHTRPTLTRELGRFKTLEEARHFHDATARRITYLARHPPPNLVPDARLIMAAGDKYFGITLQEAHHTFAYDPDTGDLIWRSPPAYVGLKAGKPGATVPALYVSLHGRRYPVHALAWFLTHAEWPKRKSIGWRNGDQTDNRLSNLYLTTEGT